MNTAAILLAVDTAPKPAPKWVVQSAIVGTRYLVKVDGKNCGRGRFVEARHFLTPWMCQARKFDNEAAAETFAGCLEPAADQSVKVVVWNEAWHEEVTDHRWHGTLKIRPTLADHDRPLLEIVRLYAKALDFTPYLAQVMPAALAFGLSNGIQAPPRNGAAGAKVGGICGKLDHWRMRLQAAGLSTTTLQIVEGPAAARIANETQKLGSRVIAIGAQHAKDVRLFGALLRDKTALLRDAPCPVLISEPAQVTLTNPRS